MCHLHTVPSSALVGPHVTAYMDGLAESVDVSSVVLVDPTGHWVAEAEARCTACHVETGAVPSFSQPVNHAPPDVRR